MKRVATTVAYDASDICIEIEVGPDQPVSDSWRFFGGVIRAIDRFMSILTFALPSPGRPDDPTWIVAVRADGRRARLFKCGAAEAEEKRRRVEKELEQMPL